MVQVPSGIAPSAMRASPQTVANGNTARGKPVIIGNGSHPIPAPVHLSAMRGQPLDMSSVERRGQPTASRENVKRLRPFELDEAPTYYPTEEQFKDPFAYMRMISPEASKYGIAKIIPPDSWKPEFAIDTERFHFRTRKQELNSVEGKTRANLTYLDQLAKFHKQHGTNLNRFPSVDKRPLDLYKLKKAVESRGGFEKVCKQKKWAEIGRDLGYSGKIMSSLSTSLKNSYQRWLFPYEEYLRLAKPGVHAQLEFEYGGPMTPSPANSPMKKPHQHTPSSLRDDSPAIRAASDALNASMDFKNIPMLDAYPQPRPPPPPPPPSGGFTAVNSGGFTAINSAPVVFTPINGYRREREPETSFTPPRRSVESPYPSAKNTPEYRPSGLGSIPLTNGHVHVSNPMKRQLSTDSIDSRKENSNPSEEGENGYRRSKRAKKESVPTVAGSHMTLFRPSAPKIRDGTSNPGERCEQCGKTEDVKSILQCEGCDNGWHMFCLDPPISQKPQHDWFCPRCLVGDGNFGFQEGGIYSLKQFQEKAADFKENYFQNKMPFDPVFNCNRPVTEDDIEREFWKLVTSLEETVEVEYGADIHSTTHGSGFPTVEKHPKDPYATNPWNLNVMPLHNESLFRHIKSDISGMTVPWLYVGMIFSTFCWHNEDHHTYSANYQHFGSTKTWYGIPGEDAEKFEQTMREAVPELFETQPDLLFQLVTLLTPEQLKKAGVRVYAADQRAGQFVITFPQAYHAGFNHGFNFNEAVNFAPDDWEPFGAASVEQLQQFRKSPCFSHDALLWTAAERDTTIETSKWLGPALQRMQAREMEQRKLLTSKHKESDHQCIITNNSEGEGSRCQLEYTTDEQDTAEEDYQCVYCKAFSYLSRFKCNKSGKVLCLLHAGNYACCEKTEEQRYAGEDHSFLVRRTDTAIDTLVKKVVDKGNLPEAWEEKVAKALEETATPSLKTLRTLVNEGERIPYELPSLSGLKDFVDRCNEWVEEANNYTRKQTTRRKNEKGGRKSTKAAEQEEREREYRKVENIIKLIKRADDISFDCPEIQQLRERADAIKTWRRDAQSALDHQIIRSTSDLEELMELGKGYNVDLPEIEMLDKVVQQMKWKDRARERQTTVLTLTEVQELISDAEKLGIPDYYPNLMHFKMQRDAGEVWEAKARELMSVEFVHYPQLEALSTQAQVSGLPISPDTLAQVNQILNKQREAHRQIISLYERSKEVDFRRRPKYQEVRETMEALAELNSKPNGTIDLEREQKRHEDWMRKGKKLFGKANAPLHILKSHMEYVLERNVDCFDLEMDLPRQPAEPASREASPIDNNSKLHDWDDPRFREVFCICRKVEAGMMIECELCHEWYHGKCLKIARGKVKDDEKYTCPICDWRVKIPRDAARPKLEDLQAWQAEIPNLPFQPDEEEILQKIIDNGQNFRTHVMTYCNPIMTTHEEADTQRFYLRKIEGAEILLAYETNFFRQELHKWNPVAPEAPPVLDQSKSTRKPRPTKLQKLMAQHGVDDPEALPQGLRTKQHTFSKNKSTEPTSKPPNLQPAPGRSNSGTPTSHSFQPSGPSMSGPSVSGPSISHPSISAPAIPGPSISVPPMGIIAGAPVGMPSHHNSPYSYESRYGMGGPSNQPYTAHPYLKNQPSIADPPSSFNPNPSHPSNLESAMFSNSPGFAPAQGLDSPMRDNFTSSQGPNIDKMFNDLTNQEDEPGNASPALTTGDSASQNENKDLEQPNSSYPIGPLEDSDEDVLGPGGYPVKSFRQLIGVGPSSASTKDSVLIIIDAQNEYANGLLRTENVAETRKAIANLLEKYRTASAPVVHVVHQTPDGAPVFTPNTDLAKVFSELEPKQGEKLITKQYPGSFTGTDLQEYLVSTGKSKVVLTGFMAHVCVSTTARQAAEKGFHVVLASSAIDDRNIPGLSASNVVEATLAALADAFGTVVNGDDIN